MSQYPPVFEQLTRIRSGLPENRVLPPVSEHFDAEALARPFRYRTLWGEERTVDIEPFVQRDRSSLPVLQLREGYSGANHGQYWLSGLSDALCMIDALERLGMDPRGPGRFLEFGCASGRVIRHMAANLPAWRFSGADFDRDNVAWMRDNLPHIRVLQNSALPNLPFEDGSFDALAAFSVFTHIDLFEVEWLAELRRLLRPGGVAFISIHSERTWARIPSRQPHLEKLKMFRADDPAIKINADLFRSPMPQERFVLRWKGQGPYACNTYQTTDYIRRVWGQWLDVVDIHDGAVGGFQDMVVLRKGS